MVTVGELIERLRAFPQDLPVVVVGSGDGGYDHLGTIERVTIGPVEERSHYGEFDALDPPGRALIGPPFDAVFLDA